MDRAKRLGFDGLQLDGGSLAPTVPDYLNRLRLEPENCGLLPEYNWSMGSSNHDIRGRYTMEEGSAVAARLGADIGKISMDLGRPRPRCARRFHPEIKLPAASDGVSKRYDSFIVRSKPRVVNPLYKPSVGHIRQRRK